MNDKKRISNKTFWIIMIIVCISFVSILVGIRTYNTYADEETYTGEFILANKIYMPNNNIKLVIYFNETESTKYIIFDDWDARHSVLLSNVLVEGDRVKIFYKEYVFREFKELVRIEVL